MEFENFKIKKIKKDSDSLQLFFKLKDSTQKSNIVSSKPSTIDREHGVYFIEVQELRRKL